MKKTVKFRPESFESKWQKTWEKERIYHPDMKKAKKPFFNLMMFPYPSAEGLHVGNVYAFTGADIYGRFQRMRGNDVFEPIGLDGFGIHSENYAIKVGRHPKKQAKISEENFYRQLRSIGNSFAWENKVETYDPGYYKWTQWLFVQMFKNGLAYQKKSPINFCPSCKTGLADEQVIDGACERCSTIVVKKEMEQWYFRITDYAEKLLQNTYKKSFKWTKKVKVGQQNWIGKKEGIAITYKVFSTDGKKAGLITCFTTRPDTNFGATFIVLGPEHSFVASLLNSKFGIQKSKLLEIKQYVEEAKNKSEIDRIAEGRKKTGVFTTFYAVNQLTGYKMPVYISDFVLGNVGTGAVVGVPGHDKRDFEFAKEFGLKIIRVVVGSDNDKSSITKIDQVQEEEGTMINSGFLDGMDIHKATSEIMDYLEKKKWGKRVTTYKLRDWCISRQRYWGAPIPMIYCSSCAKLGKSWFSTKEAKKSSEKSKVKSQKSNVVDGWYPVSEKDLPVLLPDVDDWKPEGTGKGPLAKVDSFRNIKCPECGKKAERETDVCDTFLDSSWYFLRYPSTCATSSKKEAFVKDITRKWLPVNQYIGGAEHTVLHLLYSRFVTMTLKDMGYLDFEEPYDNFYAHGLIIAEGAKMSKSRGNVIVPDEYINKYGADTLRTYLMFLGPFDKGGDFRDTGIAGMYRFLGRVWRLVTEYIESRITNHESREKENSSNSVVEKSENLSRVMHKAIREVTEDMEHLRYNTAVAHIMTYVNQMIENKKQLTEAEIKTLLLLLAPFAPHMTEELFQRLSHEKSKVKSQMSNVSSIHLRPWPSYDPKYLVEETKTIIVQINGKLRDTVKVQSAKCKVQSEVETEVKKSEKVQKYIKGKKIRKAIFVPGRLINFVL